MVHSVLLASPRGPAALKTHTSEDADVGNDVPSNKCAQIEGFKETAATIDADLFTDLFGFVDLFFFQVSATLGGK